VIDNYLMDNKIENEIKKVIILYNLQKTSFVMCGITSQRTISCGNVRYSDRLVQKEGLISEEEGC